MARHVQPIDRSNPPDLPLNLFFFVFSLPSIVLAQETAKKESDGLKSNIIDPLLHFFKNDYTAIYLAAIMVVLAIILIMEYRQRISVPVIKDLQNINNLFSKTYNSESFSENIEEHTFLCMGTETKKSYSRIH